jgi:arylsulfatase A-like enzyme
VASLDRALATLFDGLRRRGLLDHAIVVVTADHGEEFREHQALLHGTALYEESVRVPLIVAGAGVPAGRVVSDRVSLVDVAPTILARAGLAPEPRFEGRSLLDVAPAPATPSDVLLELFPIAGTFEIRRHSAGLLHAQQKLLVGPAPHPPQVFDLRTDPHEMDRNPASPEDAARLEGLLATREAALATRAGTAETTPVSPEMQERLRALGYAH